MHEGSFTEEIVQAILKELGDRPGQHASRVRVRVGEMLHLQSDAVRLHFGLLTKGTGLEGAELELEEVPVRVRCRGCGAEGPVEDHHLLACPVCGEARVVVLEGKDVFIQSVDLEQAPPV